MGTPYTQYTAGDGISEDINTDYGYLRDNVIEIPTAEAIDASSVPKPVYIDKTSGWLGLCDANDEDKLDFVGFVLLGENVGSGEFAKCVCSVGIVIKGFSGLSRGNYYYLQDDGSIGTALGTYEVLVGIAISATELLTQKGSWEYMGSDSDSHSRSDGVYSMTTLVTVPANAKFAIFKIRGYSGGSAGAEGSDAVETGVIARVGANDLHTQAQASQGHDARGNIIWSSNTITATMTISANHVYNSSNMSLVCYFYK